MKLATFLLTALLAPCATSIRFTQQRRLHLPIDLFG